MNVFGLYSLSYGKFFFDPIYNVLIVRPLLGVARLAAWFDRRVIDCVVDALRLACPCCWAPPCGRCRTG